MASGQSVISALAVLPLRSGAVPLVFTVPKSKLSSAVAHQMLRMRHQPPREGLGLASSFCRTLLRTVHWRVCEMTRRAEKSGHTRSRQVAAIVWPAGSQDKAQNPSSAPSVALVLAISTLDSCKACSGVAGKGSGMILTFALAQLLRRVPGNAHMHGGSGSHSGLAPPH